MISNLRFSENAPAYDSCSEWGRYKAGSARVFGYTVYRGFLNWVYGISQLKYGFSLNFRYKVYLGVILGIFGWIFGYTGIPLPPLADPDKGNCKFLLRWFRDGFLSLPPNVIPASFFWVKCVRFSPCYDRYFRKRPGGFRRFPTNYRRLPNVAENQMSADVLEDVWALSKLLKRRYF